MVAKKEFSHKLVPVHTKLSEKDKKELLAKYNINVNELPKIYANDPGIAHLDIKDKDVIKITRKSPTAGESVFFRGVLGD